MRANFLKGRKEESHVKHPDPELFIKKKKGTGFGSDGFVLPYGRKCAEVVRQLPLREVWWLGHGLGQPTPLLNSPTSSSSLEVSEFVTPIL